MAQNFRHEGNHLIFTAGADVASGQPVQNGKIVGISLRNVANGAKGQMATRGVFQLAKKASLAITAGDALYWDASPGEITATAADGFFIGFAAETVAGSATKVEVLLVQDAGQSSIPVAAVVAAVTTANGSDAATTQALANQLKTSLNAILTSLKDAGIMAS